MSDQRQTYWIEWKLKSLYGYIYRTPAHGELQEVVQRTKSIPNVEVMAVFECPSRIPMVLPSSAIHRRHVYSAATAILRAERTSESPRPPKGLESRQGGVEKGIEWKVAPGTSARWNWWEGEWMGPTTV